MCSETPRSHLLMKISSGGPCLNDNKNVVEIESTEGADILEKLPVSTEENLIETNDLLKIGDKYKYVVNI